MSELTEKQREFVKKYVEATASFSEIMDGFQELIDANVLTDLDPIFARTAENFLDCGICEKHT